MTKEQLEQQAAMLAKLVQEKLEAEKATTDPSKGPDDEPGELSAETKAQMERIVNDQIAAAKKRDEQELRKSGGFKQSEQVAKALSRSVEDNDFNPNNPNTDYAKVYTLSKNDLKTYFSDGVVESVERFKQLQDAAFLAGCARAHRLRKSYGDVVKDTELYGRLQQRLKSDGDLRKALDTATSGEGSEWIPTGFSSQLLDRIRLEFRVAAQFQEFAMPTNPFRFPVTNSDATAYYIAEATADSATKINAATPGTTNVEFSAKKLASRVLFSEEINEDSAVNMMDFVRTQLAVAIAKGVEQAILDGDDSTTHQDTDVTSANDARKAFKGHRYWALNNAGTATKSFSSGNPTTTLMRSTRELMGKYGVEPGNLFWVVSPKVYIKMLSVSEVQKLNEYGQGATLITGELARFDGIPVVVSEHVREVLNTSGVYQSGQTLSAVHLVDRRGFMTGVRSGVTINSMRDFETDQMIMVAKYRLDHEDVFDATAAANIQSVLGIAVKTT